MMQKKLQRMAKYANDVDLLLSLVNQKGLDIFEEERKTSVLYQLEAEEIDVKNLEVKI